MKANTPTHKYKASIDGTEIGHFSSFTAAKRALSRKAIMAHPKGGPCANGYIDQYDPERSPYTDPGSRDYGWAQVAHYIPRGSGGVTGWHLDQ